MDYGREMFNFFDAAEDGEEEHDARMNGFSNYDLGIIHENPDDELAESHSKSKHDSPPQDGPTKAPEISVQVRTKKSGAPKEVKLAYSPTNFDKKEEDARLFLKNMQTKAEKDKVKKFMPKNLRPVEPYTLLNKNIELSQMSEWTDKGTNGKQKNKGNINIAQVNKLQDKNLNS